MKFYIDMDDTLANFRDHAVACGVPPWTGTWYATDPKTWTPEQHAIQARTNEIMEDPEFWLSMPVIDGAFEIISACASRGETFLLTAYPRTCPDKVMVERVKKEWANRVIHFNPNRVIVCERPDKIHYAISERTWDGKKPAVLIDDADKNCAEWTEAGGLALHYRGSMQEMIDAVKKLDDRYIFGIDTAR